MINLSLDAKLYTGDGSSEYLV